jgi:hypothetical protein
LECNTASAVRLKGERVSGTSSKQVQEVNEEESSGKDSSSSKDSLSSEEESEQDGRAAIPVTEVGKVEQADSGAVTMGDDGSMNSEEVVVNSDKHSVKDCDGASDDDEDCKPKITFLKMKILLKRSWRRYV